MSDSLVSATAQGDRRQTLVALRDKLAEVIDATESARDLPPLIRQLRDVMEDIYNLPDPEVESPVDALVKGHGKTK